MRLEDTPRFKMKGISAPKGPKIRLAVSQFQPAIVIRHKLDELVPHVSIYHTSSISSLAASQSLPYFSDFNYVGWNMIARTIPIFLCALFLEFGREQRENEEQGFRLSRALDDIPCEDHAKGKSEETVV